MTKETKEFSIPIQNPYKTKKLEYRVETDIPNFFGSEKISL